MMGKLKGYGIKVGDEFGKWAVLEKENELFSSLLVDAPQKHLFEEYRIGDSI